MKKICAILLVLPLLLLGADGPVAPTPANPTAILQWDAPTTNADGTPCTDLAGYVIALSDATMDLATSGPPLCEVRQSQPQVTTQSLAPLVSGRAAGVYRLWVRAFDAAGNESVWSDPFLVEIDPTAPAKPGGLRVTVTVTVEVR
jgi:hypothetical protein